MSYGAASSLTEVSPRASRARMPRRVESERAANVASSAESKYLTIWFSIVPPETVVKQNLERPAIPQSRVEGHGFSRAEKHAAPSIPERLYCRGTARRALQSLSLLAAGLRRG